MVVPLGVTPPGAPTSCERELRRDSADGALSPALVAGSVIPPSTPLRVLVGGELRSPSAMAASRLSRGVRRGTIVPPRPLGELCRLAVSGTLVSPSTGVPPTAGAACDVGPPNAEQTPDVRVWSPEDEEYPQCPSPYCGDSRSILRCTHALGRFGLSHKTSYQTFRLITYQAVVNPLGGTYHELRGSRAQMALCPTTRRLTPIWVSVVRVPRWNTGERIAVLLIRKPSQQTSDRYIAV